MVILNGDNICGGKRVVCSSKWHGGPDNIGDKIKGSAVNCNSSNTSFSI